VKIEGDGGTGVIADGLIYVNSEEAGEVVVFDPKSLEVKQRFPHRRGEGADGSRL